MVVWQTPYFKIASCPLSAAPHWHGCCAGSSHKALHPKAVAHHGHVLVGSAAVAAVRQKAQLSDKRVRLGAAVCLQRQKTACRQEQVARDMLQSTGQTLKSQGRPSAANSS